MSATLTYLGPCVMAGLLVLRPTPTFAADASSVPRLRAGNAVLARVIAEASARSATFRTLLDNLARTDGLVYVESGSCGHGVRACLAHSITRAGPYRMVFIVIDSRDARNRRDVKDLVGTIAHELQHALEILTEPGIDDNADVYMFYARTAGTTGGTFETGSAIQAGNRAAREMTARRLPAP